MAKKQLVKGSKKKSPAKAREPKTNEKITAIFIGRFQPPHKGHISAVKQILNQKNIAKLVIGIGSSNAKISKKNPFTIKERKDMIKAVLKQKTKTKSTTKNKKQKTTRIKIIELPDVNNKNKTKSQNDKAWLKKAIALLNIKNQNKKNGTNNTIIFSRNNLTLKLFKTAKFTTKKQKKTININATAIRKKIENKDLSWKKYVPKIVWGKVKKIEKER